MSWWRRGSLSGDGVRSIMQVQDLQYAEQKDMALELKKLADSQARIVAVLDSCVTLIAAQNEKIATLTAQLAAPPVTDQIDQKAVDAVAQALADKADAVATALPPSQAQAAPPPPTAP